jgi:copper transport protein
MVLLAAASLAAAAQPGAVDAHALLRASEPPAGATLGSAPSNVLLTFGETPDLRLTSVKVLDSGGRDHAAGSLEAVADPADSIRVPIDALADGVYTVSWRTVSAVDGHLSAGSFAFGVGVAPPTRPPDQAIAGAGQEGSPPAIGARWLLYLGLVALLGAAFAALAVAHRPAPDLLAMAAAGWILAAIGTVGVVAVQWAETGAPLEQLPSTSIGLAAFARLAALSLVGVALAALAVVPRLGARRGWLGVGVASALALGVDVSTGHAAAGPEWLSQSAVQLLHALGAAAWLGGLAGLLVLLRTTPASERLATARRFSSWAGVALVVVALTGSVRAVGEVGTVDALIGTDFGRVVLAKSAVLLGLAGLGALNRFVTLRDAAQVVRGLRRIGGMELALAAVVLGLSAWLVNLTPPTSAGGPVEPVAHPIVATGHDFGTSVRVRLIATPGAAGNNDFDVALADYDTGEPVDASRVDLRFELASQAGVGPSTLVLERSAPGRFRATAANLSIDGMWRLTATVTVPGGAVEVPLLAVTTVPAQPVQRLVSPDVPTIYVVQLGAVGSAQVYLDPDAPGPNELHVTFFDPAGSELPIQSVTIATNSEGTGAGIPTARRLEPGHFVASIDAVAGPLAVDAIGPLPGGAGQVHLHVTIEVEP